MKTRLATLSAVAAMAAVGLACGPPEKPPAVSAPATQAAVPPPTTLTPCNPLPEDKVVVAPSELADGTCGLTVTPNEVCLEPGGTIEWEVDGAHADWEACKKNKPKKKPVKKVKFRDFEDTNGNKPPIFDKNCKLEMPKPNKTKPLRCTLEANVPYEDYKYAAAGLDEDDDDVVENDPIIRVRGGVPPPLEPEAKP